MNTVVIGLQWGDEGKAKIVDHFAQEYGAVVRFNGGANAGHTTKAKVGDKDIEFVFHLMPAGALYEGKACVIGNGVVLDPFQLEKEIQELESHGLTIRDRLYLSESTHLVLPIHKLLDQKRESRRGKQSLGTTSRGIGPAYREKAGRTGLRVADALHKEYFQEKMKSLYEDVAPILGAGFEPSSYLQDSEDYYEIIQSFKGNITDTTLLLSKLQKEGSKLLFEGAQACFLDIDHGTYPYVSSSNSSSGGACTGSGVGPRDIHNVVGVLKAYCTRVGTGIFLTELNREEQEEKLAEELREVGAEYGATTGRPRRIGWLDGVFLRKSVALNSLDGIALTKIDVLDGQEEIKVATSYRRGEQLLDRLPACEKDWDGIEPVYTSFEGWKGKTMGCKSKAELPVKARDYLHALEEIASVPIVCVSTGPKRSELIHKGEGSWLDD